MTKDWLTDEIVSEERSVVLLALIMGVLYAASFTILFVAELMPVEVHEAWALLPSSRSVVATQVAAQ